MRLLLPCAFVFSCLLAGAAQALEVRFYPRERIYAYELDAAHEAMSVMVHNIAIINDTSASVALSEVTLELMSAGRALDARTLGEPELARSAAGGAAVQGAGLIEALAFQFGGTELLPQGTRLSVDLRLDPGEALMINAQVFAYRGSRDALRVRVNGGAAAQASLPIRTGSSQAAFAFPLRGAWYNGAGASFHTHHRWTPMEEFAFDLVRLGANGRTHRGDGARFTDYYAYGEPVFAAAAGRVAFVVADETEDASAMKRQDESIEAYFTRLRQDQFTRIARGARGVGGNQIIVDHGGGEFSFYGHLRPGSVAVREGDGVTRGQRIAAVGSSGNSTEPHLHFHVCNSADPLMCAGIPVQWDRVEQVMPDPARAPQSGDFLQPAN